MPLFVLFSRIIIFERNYGKMKVKTIFILLAALLFFVAACGSANNAPMESELTNAENIGEGATVFRFNAIDGEENVNAWLVHTNESTVGAALVDVGLIEGEVSEFGLMVMYVNGVRADYEEDGAWWAFWIGDEMAVVGVDATDIEEGVTYAFVYTPA